MVAILFVACGGAEPARTPPERIVAAFTQLYPQAHITKWNDEPPNWEAKYTLGTVIGAVSFNANAEVIETELVVSESQVPDMSAIQEYVTAHYPSEKIQRCEMITAQNGTITYEIQITGKELVFDARAAFIKEEQD